MDNAMGMAGGVAAYRDAGPNSMAMGRVAPEQAPDRALQGAERRVRLLGGDLSAILHRLEGTASRLHGAAPVKEGRDQVVGEVQPAIRGNVPGINQACGNIEETIKRLYAVCETLDAL